VGTATVGSRGPHRLTEERVRSPVEQGGVGGALVRERAKQQMWGREAETVWICHARRTFDRMNIEIIAAVERRDLEGGGRYRRVGLLRDLRRFRKSMVTLEYLIPAIGWSSSYRIDVCINPCQSLEKG